MRTKMQTEGRLRVPLELAVSMVDRIDNWRFAHRMPNRSEAVRRLIEIGMEKSAPPEGR